MKIEMSVEMLSEQYPELYKEIAEKGKKEGFDEGQKTGFEKGKTEGAETERGRIKSVEDQLIPGHEALISTLKFDGKTTGPEAAIKVLAAEKEVRKVALKDMKDGGIQPISQPPVPGVEVVAEVEEDFEKKVQKYQDEKKCGKSEAIQAVAKAYPELHEKYIKKINPDKE